MGVPEVPPRSNRLVLALPRYQSWLASNSIAVTVVTRHNEVSYALRSGLSVNEDVGVFAGCMVVCGWIGLRNVVQGCTKRSPLLVARAG